MKKILAAMVFFGACLYATPTCTTPVDVYTNQTLLPGTVLTLDSSDSCNIGGYVFSNFQVVGGAGDDFIGSFDLDVTVTNDTLAFSFSNLGTWDIDLYYTITPGIPNMTLQAGTTSSVSEVICSTAFLVPNSTCTGTVLNQTSPFGVSSTSTTASTLVTSAAEDYVVKDIVGGSEVYQTVVPEPMTMSLMGVGLLGLGLFGRRLRK